MKKDINKDADSFLDINHKDLFLFTGGYLSFPTFRESHGTRNFIGHFEEYIRWCKTKKEARLMERFVVNTSEPNQSITDLVKHFVDKIGQFKPTVVVYMMSTENYLNTNRSLKEYGENLQKLISFVLKLNNGRGKFVLQYPWKSFKEKENEQLENYRKYVEDRVLPYFNKNQQERILTVDYYEAMKEEDLNHYINENHYPNKEGQLNITSILVEKLYGKKKVFAAETLSKNIEIKEILPAVSPLVNDKVERLQEIAEPLTWLFIGDSISHGSIWTYGFDSYIQLFEKYIKEELKRHRDIFVNVSVYGATIPSTLDRIEYRIKPYSPDITHIMLGANDVVNYDSYEYKRNLITLLSHLKQKKTKIIVSTPTPANFGKLEAERLPEYVKRIKEIVKMYPEIILIDQYTLLNQQLNNLDHLWNPEYGIYTDGASLHLGPNGHLFMFRNLLNELDLNKTYSPMLDFYYSNTIDDSSHIRTLFEKL